MMVIMCINCFTKMVQLVPLQESDECTMADKFLSSMVSQYGLPECIMNYHDPCFHGNFWEELMALLDTTLTFSIALQPQTDRISEVMNHTIE